MKKKHLKFIILGICVFFVLASLLLNTTLVQHHPTMEKIIGDTTRHEDQLFVDAEKKTILNDIVTKKKAVIPNEIVAEKKTPKVKILNDLIDEIIELATSFGPSAEQNYKNAVSELREFSEHAAQRLIKTYHDAPETSYSRRYLLVQILRELETDAAYHGLFEIAATDIPAEKSGDSAFSTVAQEAAIRMNAILGMTEQAISSNLVEDAFFELIHKHDDPAVKSFAINGYLNLGPDFEERAEALEAHVSEEYKHLIYQAPMDIDEIPYPDIAEVENEEASENIIN